ncbi:MlaC/ttg2D family ABC transporter substrate-binding protein [Candidatus Binatus sp.]|uniref:MlaC/ttg2D family ABC transporter substrate-binding protein n=1 Tax=Candidatus Binatus sp. TaxID=2811406 RepID=UPI003BB16008
MKFNLRSVALGALISFVFAASASAQTMVSPPTSPNDAMGSVKSVIDQSIVVFKNQQISAPDREQKLRAIAESHFDFTEMAKSAIGYHWRTLTPAQQSEFVPLFTTFIEDAYLSRIESYSVEKVNQQIQSSMIQFVKQTTDGPEYAQVYSTVVLQDSKNPIAVNYLMRNDSGEWKIYDITIDAISVIANYRNQFNRVLNNGGYDKLIEIIRQKIQGLQQQATN